MDESRPQKIVNLLSALLVLLAGFYVIIFLPLRISPAARVIFGILLIVYFLLRMRYFRKRYGGRNRES
jgi:hypothetical protein